MKPRTQSRRRFLRNALTSASAALLAGCDALSNSSWFPRILGSAEHLTRGLHHLLTSRRSMAQVARTQPQGQQRHAVGQGTGADGHQQPGPAHPAAPPVRLSCIG